MVKESVYEKFKKTRKSSNKGMADVVRDDPELQNALFYKYLCPRCTGPAYYTDTIEDEHPVTVCRECKLPIPDEVDKTRFIRLSDEDAKYAGLI